MLERTCPGCTRKIQTAAYACPACWRSIPRHLRQAVSVGWAKVLAGKDGSLQEHAAAKAAAGRWLKENPR